MRIGLFGGTFNPIHHGHLRAAKEVQEGFNLKKLYLIPSALPPHKDMQDVVSATDRINMTRLAVQDLPDFILSDVELKRAGPSYTIDTVRYFKNQLESDSTLFLILGLDAFLEIDTWKSYKQLFQMIPMIVMTRPLPAVGSNHIEWKNMTEMIQTKISGSYQFSEKKGCYRHDRHYPVYRHTISMLDISGTKIRNLVQQKRSIRFLVPGSVENYIHERGLYA